MEDRRYSDHYQGRSEARYYQDVMLRKGGFDDLLWRSEQKLLRRLMSRHCPAHRAASVLDFACGTGRILSFLKPRVGSVVGVDISQQMLEIAKEQVPGVDVLCADIVERPEDVPGDQDIITSFRFLLNAEHGLRESCFRALREKLRDDDSILIVGLHGNPLSRRALANLRNRLVTRSRPALRSFGMADMRALAAKCGLRVVDGTGTGYLPPTVEKLLPRGATSLVEGMLAGRPLLWKYGSNLIVVCKRAPLPVTRESGER